MLRSRDADFTYRRKQIVSEKREVSAGCGYGQVFSNREIHPDTFERQTTRQCNEPNGMLTVTETNTTNCYLVIYDEDNKIFFPGNNNNSIPEQAAL